MTPVVGWTRRELLFSAVGAGCLGLFGCSRIDPDAAVTSSPRASGPGDPGSAAPAERPAAMVEAARAERELFIHLKAMTALAGVPAAQLTWLRGQVAATSGHLARLDLLDPLDPTSPRQVVEEPSPATADTVPAALAAHRARATALGRGHRERAMAETDPAMTLLWASLSVSAELAATPRLAPVKPPREPGRFTAPSSVDARQALLAHLHRAVWVTEGCVGVLPSGPQRTHLRDVGLVAVETERNQVMGLLRSAGVTPTAPQPGYRLPRRPTATTVTAVLAEVHRDVMDAWLAVTAVVAGAERATAMDRAVAWAKQASAAVPLTWWPGWR